VVHQPPRRSPTVDASGRIAGQRGRVRRFVGGDPAGQRSQRRRGPSSRASLEMTLLLGHPVPHAEMIRSRWPARDSCRKNSGPSRRCDSTRPGTPSVYTIDTTGPTAGRITAHANGRPGALCGAPHQTGRTASPIPVAVVVVSLKDTSEDGKFLHDGLRHRDPPPERRRLCLALPQAENGKLGLPAGRLAQPQRRERLGPDHPCGIPSSPREPSRSTPSTRARNSGRGGRSIRTVIRSGRGGVWSSWPLDITLPPILAFLARERRPIPSAGARDHHAVRDAAGGRGSHHQRAGILFRARRLDPVRRPASGRRRSAAPSWYRCASENICNFLTFEATSSPISLGSQPTASPIPQGARRPAARRRQRRGG